MRFAHPEILWLLPLLLLLPLARGYRSGAASLLFPSAEIARAAGRRPRGRAGRLLTALRLLGLALLIVAMARPQRGLGHAEIEAHGVDIVLAIDASGSMQALDFQLAGERQNRLAVVKSVVRDFIAARPDDRIGAIVFAARPYMLSPLTLDHDWLMQSIDRVQIGMVEDGTAIGSAIASSTSRLNDTKAKSRVAIVLTDGINNAGSVSPATAAEAAHSLGVKVYTIAAGTRGQAPMPVRDRLGRERIVMVDVQVDEALLKQVAERTGAEFFRATDTESLSRIYAQIDQLEKSEVKLRRFQRYRDLYVWPLLAGLAMLLLEVALAETRLRRLP